jgi:ubiquinone/menaquinone biosynthesis C-methylase UbiE
MEREMAEDHNKIAAELWSEGGADYDGVSYAISDALAHAAQRLWARPGERILDIATGTGWCARNVARNGATVIGVDIADELLVAAKRLSAHVEPKIEFQHADAEALPFDDGAFDGVISTFGIMFAGNQEKAAAEAARVCGVGGRLVIAAWTPDPAGYIVKFFGLIGQYSDAPPPEVSPLAWGTTEHATTLLGQQFDLEFEVRDSVLYAPNAEEVWHEYQSGFGPIKALTASLSERDRELFHQDFLAFHEDYTTAAGLTLPREYLVICGTRR